jgi:hypothetical protein
MFALPDFDNSLMNYQLLKEILKQVLSHRQTRPGQYFGFALSW